MRDAGFDSYTGVHQSRYFGDLPLHDIVENLAKPCGVFTDPA